MRTINTRFFLKLAGAAVLLAGAVFVVHRLQAGNIADALLFQADQAEKNGKPEQAIGYLGRYLGFKPEELDARARLAALAADPKVATTPAKRRRARNLLDEVLARDPQRHPHRVALCRILLADPKTVDAAEEQLKVLTDRGQGRTAEVLALTAEWHLRGQRVPQAASSYRAALKADPAGLPNYVRLAAVLKHQNFGNADADAVAANKTEIAGLVAAALKHGPDDPAVLVLAAQHAQETGDPRAARAHLEAGLKKAPTDAALYLTLANLHAAEGRRPDAMQLLQTGLKAVAKEYQYELTWRLANLALDDNQLDLGRELIAKVRESNRLSADYLDGRVLMHQGRWFEAAARFEKLRPTLRPFKELALQIDLYLGSCYEHLGQPQLQLAAYERAGEVDKTSQLARRGKAAALWALGQADDALALYEAAVRDTRNRDEATRWRLEYARLALQHQGRGGKAAADVGAALDAAERDNPRSADVALLRAELSYRGGDKARAKADLERAITAAPARHEPWLALAALARADGDAAGAAATVEKAAAKFGASADFRLAQVRYWTEQRQPGTEAALRQIEAGLPALPGAGLSRVLTALADAHAHAGRPADAERLLRRVADLPPHAQDLGVRVQLFELVLAQGREADAAKVLDDIKGIEGSPAPHWSFGQAALLLARARRGDKAGLEEARGHLTAAAAGRPNWHVVQLAKAELDELQGNAVMAIDNYRKALAQGSRDPQVARHLITLLTQAQRFDEAEEEIRALQKRTAGGDELARLHVATLYNQRDYARAERALRDLLPTSNHFRDHLWAGQLRAARGQPSAEVEKSLQKAVMLGEAQPETWVALVRYLAHTGQPEKARKVLELAAAKLDGIPRALAVAQGHELLGDASRALAVYRKACEEHPQAVAVTRQAVEFYLRLGRLRDAERLLRPVVDKQLPATEADVAWARRGLALALVRGGNPKHQAEALKLVGLTLDPAGDVPPAQFADAADERLAQARVLAAVNHHRLRARAAAALDELHRQQPLTAEDQFLLARLLDQAGADAAAGQKARALLKGLTAGGSTAPRFLVYYANLLIHDKEVPAAEQVIDQLEALERERKAPAGALGTVELRALCLELRGKGAEATALLARHAAEKGAPPARTLTLAGLHGRLGEYAQACDLCYALAGQGPGAAAEAHGTAVGILRAAKPAATAPARQAAWEREADRLETALRAAAKKDADDLPARLQLADLLELRGKFADVEAVCKEVLAKDGTNLVALNNVAWLLAQSAERAAEAVALVDRAVAAYGPRPELLDTRAVAHLTLGQHDRSVRDLEKVVSEAPTPTRYLHLSRAHHQARNAGPAVAALQRATDLGLSVPHLHPADQAAHQRLTAELKRD